MDAADHRALDQWQFYVFPAHEFPAQQKTIAQSSLDRRWHPCDFKSLCNRDNEVMAALPDLDPWHATANLVTVLLMRLELLLQDHYAQVLALPV